MNHITLYKKHKGKNLTVSIYECEKDGYLKNGWSLSKPKSKKLTKSKES